MRALGPNMSDHPSGEHDAPDESAIRRSMPPVKTAGRETRMPPVSRPQPARCEVLRPAAAARLRSENDQRG